VRDSGVSAVCQCLPIAMEVGAGAMTRPLKVHEEQIKELSAPREAYEQRLVEHLERAYPDLCREKGAAGVKDDVRRLVDRAQDHGFVTEVEIARYAVIAFLFGPEFDADPAYLWAAKTLDRSTRPNWLRLEILYHEAQRALQRRAIPASP
jgi:hypothetical protein